MASPKRAGQSSNSSIPPLRSICLPSILIWIMATYIILDMRIHLFDSDHGTLHKRIFKGLQTSILAKLITNDIVKTEPKVEYHNDEKSDTDCDSIEAHMDVFEGQPRKPQDPWGQLKKGLPPAECRVKGHLIERLDPQTNYRRGIALGFTNDLDDKYPLENWFLGTKVDVNKASRRVYIDVGANQFTTSILWFMQRYPCDFTEVYAFEKHPNVLSLPGGWNEELNWVERPGWQKIRSRAGWVPSWLVQRMKIYNKAVGLEDSRTTVNITRFLKDELKLAPEDSVVVKIDIEGAEWPILYQWVKDTQLPKIIDELFVEVHYYHVDNNLLWVKQWSRENTTRMLAELRWKGWYVHYWD
ncbi:hypothetical protein R1flu_012905 [Riccia fluitans]|uniref:Methyltransferase FkbM domain-containing protein n=1 Tax=Riccia fluitans TaxID=41844 RepID=A0ABD1ZD65_9MARC